MRKVVCAPEKLIPQQIVEDIKYFSVYSNPRRDNVGYFGSTLIRDIQRAGLRPSENIWDFNTIALSVAAADNSLTRKNSADGWTRQIDLTIHLCNPHIWEPIKQHLEKTLRFLTGDFWYLTFKGDGVTPPRAKKLKQFDSNCVSLLSGGIDSLVGAIDIVADNHKPIFVSQVVRGDADIQRDYAKKIRPESPHFQWNHNIHPPKGESEGSTRGRSIIFFAFAALASSAIEQKFNLSTNIYVPENGFISLNIPLNSGRMGSFSTKTTHPIYLQGIQNIWNKVGINLNIVMPYQFKTKGEVLTECKNQQLLEKLVFQSVSCGKYRVYKMQHCGRCVPCLVRRAAFQYWGKIDKTLGGYYAEHLERINHGNPDDVGAAANACLVAEQSGINRLISGHLSFAEEQNRVKFEDVFSRGLGEIRELLLREKVI
ncbi:Qat anti-phage system QueC-like protein QatC [Otariodibacter sp.]|uniref:Qat anti-phage system QueC-like protein QatC n=1 Tax=Otariodibacter sp. TaxID=3030919 RepID=UPI00261FDFF8|nr:Qat anti-phage system QueC-like protein QatC [Otariodibacter sp.]